MTSSINELGVNLADIGDRVKREIELSDASRKQVRLTVSQLRKVLNEALDDYEKAIADELGARQDSLNELLNGDKAKETA